MIYRKCIEDNPKDLLNILLFDMFHLFWGGYVGVMFGVYVGGIFVVCWMDFGGKDRGKPEGKKRINDITD